MTVSQPGGPATRVREIDRPPDEALRLAAQAAKRVRERATPVRIRFIERVMPDDAPPPLALLLRGGRGGEVRLKLLLALLWLGAGGQHDVQFPPHSYAALLGLPDRYGNGARRVNDAINWLRDHRFITVDRVPGQSPKITLLSELGTGRTYVVPGRAPKDPATGKATPENIYVQLPVTFWTKGWVAVLSTAATAMLLVLLLLERQALPVMMKRFAQGDELGVWVSPAEAIRRFDLSEDTRSRGFRELQRHGLVIVGRQRVHGDFERRRLRNVYTFFGFVLDAGPKGLRTDSGA
jgi:hypothetical protein